MASWLESILIVVVTLAALAAAGWFINLLFVMVGVRMQRAALVLLGSLASFAVPTGAAELVAFQVLGWKTGNPIDVASAIWLVLCLPRLKVAWYGLTHLSDLPQTQLNG